MVNASLPLMTATFSLGLFTCCSKYATKDGEAGLRAVLQMLRDELEMAMGMCGRPTI
jgi:hypothetical protein